MEKPEHVQEEYLEFLDELQESGKTNMMGAVPYLAEEFPTMTRGEAKELLEYWMYLKRTGQR